MNHWSVYVVALLVGVIIVAGVFKANKPPQRETFALRFSVCEHALDLSIKCEACFLQEDPLCPVDARVMMMRPK